MPVVGKGFLAGGARDSAEVPRGSGPQDGGLQVPVRLLSQAFGHQSSHQGAHKVGVYRYLPRVDN